MNQNVEQAKAHVESKRFHSKASTDQSHKAFSGTEFPFSAIPLLTYSDTILRI